MLVLFKPRVGSNIKLSRFLIFKFLYLNKAHILRAQFQKIYPSICNMSLFSQTKFQLQKTVSLPPRPTQPIVRTLLEFGLKFPPNCLQKCEKILFVDMWRYFSNVVKFSFNIYGPNCLNLWYLRSLWGPIHGFVLRVGQ